MRITTTRRSIPNIGFNFNFIGEIKQDMRYLEEMKDSIASMFDIPFINDLM